MELLGEKSESVNNNNQMIIPSCMESPLLEGPHGASFLELGNWYANSLCIICTYVVSIYQNHM